MTAADWVLVVVEPGIAVAGLILAIAWRRRLGRAARPAVIAFAALTLSVVLQVGWALAYRAMVLSMYEAGIPPYTLLDQARVIGALGGWLSTGLVLIWLVFLTTALISRRGPGVSRVTTHAE